MTESGVTKGESVYQTQAEMEKSYPKRDAKYGIPRRDLRNNSPNAFCIKRQEITTS